MYEQASAVADELGLARADLDEWALRSHERAIAAIDAGRMAEEIVAVEVPGRGGPTLVDTDEAPRRDTTLERLAALTPLDPEHPTHTAGNSPGVNDGAAMLVVADAGSGAGARASSRSRASSRPAARPTATTRWRACPPGPRRSRSSAPGSRRPTWTSSRSTRRSPPSRCSRRAISASPPERVNVNGGAVALGHPVGASGARLVGHARLRAAPPRRRSRAGRDLLGRRPGRRDRDRGRRSVTAARVVVVGAGQMGAGIAQVAAAAGMSVTLVDVGEAQLERALTGIGALAREARLEGPVRRPGRRARRASRPPPAWRARAMPSSRSRRPARTSSSSSRSSASSTRRSAPQAVLASNTSSIPIGRLAAATGRPAQVCGMHFMNPPGADAAGRADPRPGDERRDRRARPRGRRGDGQDGGRGARRARASWPTACSCRCSTRRPSASTRASATPRPSTRSCGSA